MRQRQQPHQLQRGGCLNNLVLRCTLFMFCVEAALLAKRAFVACFASWVFRIVHHVYTCITQVAARKQRPCPSNTGRWFCRFLVIYRRLDKGARGGGVMLFACRIARQTGHKAACFRAMAGDTAFSLNQLM